GGIVIVVVSTARSGATRASATRQPRRRSSRRTRAAAPRSESSDPLRPLVGTRSTPSSLSPSRNATSVVAFPTSTPATTVTGTWHGHERDFDSPLGSPPSQPRPSGQAAGGHDGHGRHSHVP